MSIPALPLPAELSSVQGASGSLNRTTRDPPLEMPALRPHSKVKETAMLNDLVDLLHWIHAEKSLYERDVSVR